MHHEKMVCVYSNGCSASVAVRHGRSCGGNCIYDENGTKDCSRCIIPHQRDNYDRIVSKYKEIMDVVRMQDKQNVEKER